MLNFLKFNQILNKNLTKVSPTVVYSKVLSRSMLSRIASTATKETVKTLEQQNIIGTKLYEATAVTVEKRNVVRSAYKCQSQKAVQEVATDGSGLHVVGTVTKCDDSTCEIKTCPAPCGPIQEFKVTGNFTHKLPSGSRGEHLSSSDYNGNASPQEYATDTKKTLSGDQLRDLTEDDLKKNISATKFMISSQDIIDKTK